RDVALGEVGHRGEESVVLRLVRDPAVELDEEMRVVWPDGPDVRGAAVAEQDVGLPVMGCDVRVGVRGGHGRNLQGRDVADVSEPQRRTAYLRCSTRSPCTTTCGSSSTISSVSEPRNLLP